MATSAVYLSPSKTCTWLNGPTVLENLPMYSSNKYAIPGPRQSTTLFHSKILVNSRFLSGNDNEAQVKSSYQNLEKEIIKMERNATKNIADGHKSLLISKSEKNQHQLSLGRIPQFAKCFTCERIIKEDHFSEHLLFGPAKCFECHASYNDCQSFQLWSAEQSIEYASCSHSVNFCYIYDPVKYLTENLSKSENIEKSKIPFKINDFIKKCSSLNNKLPWKHGINVCKEYLGYENMQSSVLCEGEPRKSNLDMFGIAKRQKVNGIYDGHNEQFANTTNHTEEDSFGVMLSQDFNLKELEDATEFVEIRENTFHKESSNKNKIEMQVNKKKRKPIKDPYKSKRKQIKNTEESCRKQINDTENSSSKQIKDTNTSSDESLEYLPVPSNGFYYVTTKSIEDCPNCNEVLCPLNFTVNVTSFLITTVCTSCDLTIYITSPEVQILTNEDTNSGPTNRAIDDTNSWKTNSTQVMQKKRGRPKKLSL